MPLSTDEKFMRAALAEAQKASGRTSPNPAVGAVLVQDGRIIGRGFHRASGLPHAEIECLRFVRGRPLHGATLYITLEPCSTTGRTPPCTQAIIESRVGRVVIGALDVNPVHAGRGIRELTAANVNISSGILADECSRLNEAFNKWIVTQHPFVIAKCGMSLDGRLTKPSNKSRWITSPAARRHAMQLRAQVDAVLIGAETLRRDNPRLTTRGMLASRQPWRVIVSGSGNLPRKAHLFVDRFASRTLVYREKTLTAVLADLGRKEITSVLIEGGGNVLGQAFDERLVDKVQFYVAPLFTGGPVPAVAGKGVASTAGAARLERVRYEQIARDFCVIGYPRWE